MAVNTDNPREPDGPLEDFPTFDLGYMIDTKQIPPTVILFPHSPETAIHSEWIRSDLASTVPLEDVA